jgi:hypothetical protein
LLAAPLNQGGHKHLRTFNLWPRETGRRDIIGKRFDDAAAAFFFRFDFKN